jgi:D-sedoheptulose 7-phosphate isomerase
VKSTTQLQLHALIEHYPKLQQCEKSIVEAFEMLLATYRGSGKLLVCGNGGSAADAEHLVGELMNKFQLRRPLPPHLSSRLYDSMEEADARFLAENLQQAYPAISLVSQSALATAIINDVNADMIFAQQVYCYGHSSDTLLAISTSGTSRNIIYAVEVARVLGVRTIGLSGSDGGRLKGLCDCTICVPATQTAAIQELHLPVYHALCGMVERELFEPAQ